ncbi:ionotropic receptor 21a-like [Panulirus ornatus]|uniref:ionotropic receptor 21a-like n=1 Tax=Panulirus ornatus TaxID=150431 RepID=UPI003A8BB974
MEDLSLCFERTLNVEFDGALTAVLDGALTAVFDGALTAVFDGGLIALLDGAPTAVELNCGLLHHTTLSQPFADFPLTSEEPDEQTIDVFRMILQELHEQCVFRIFMNNADVKKSPTSEEGAQGLSAGGAQYGASLVLCDGHGTSTRDRCVHDGCGGGRPGGSGAAEASVMSDGVRVYRRCLYCNSGRPDVHFLYLWNLTSLAHQTQDLFHEQFQNFMGHKFRVVTVPFAPYMDFERNTDEPGTIVTPTDSLDTRLIHTFSNSLNFTFEVWEEPTRSWGRVKDGMFSGMMGQLQREEADFCTISGPTFERLRAIQYLRGYPSDTFNIVSRKPSLLPKHLSLMRPFAGGLWLVLLVIVVAWAVILWLLQKVWWWVAGGRGVGFNITLQYTWGALLEQPPSDPSINTSGRMLVGWWLVFCLVIDTAYRSSLVAHMTVQGKTTPPETFEDLVRLDGWTWGTETWVLRGYPYEYFSTHTDPVVQKMFQKMEVMGAEEALQKMLQGAFALLGWVNYLAILIGSHYTDSHGNTPFYMSKTGVPVMADFGWGFRMGAPFYARFGQFMGRLQNAGIISYWIDEVIAGQVREKRKASLEPEEDSSQVVLGLEHLQGAFYLLLLGSGLAFLTLFGENLARSCPSVRHFEASRQAGGMMWSFKNRFL